MRRGWEIDFKTLQHRPLREYSKGELAYSILLIAAIPVAVAGSMAIAPGIGGILKLFPAKNKRERLRIKRNVQSLQRRGLLTSPQGEGYARPTAKGAAWLAFENSTIRKSRKWDGRWRLVMFDIPEPARKSRITLSRKLIEMGMRHLQDSVFISPYPCEKEIAVVSSFLHVEKYVHTAIAINLSSAARFRKDFGL